MKPFTSKIAQAAWAEAAAKRTRPQLPRYDSRAADKFVIRASEELYAAMAHLGKAQGRSANAEITQAVMASLAGRQREIITRSVFISHLGEELAGLVLKQVHLFNAALTGRSNNVIRLPDGIRSSVAEAVLEEKRIGGHRTTMKDYVLDALLWWVNTSREIYALQNACISLASSQPTLSAQPV